MSYGPPPPPSGGVNPYGDDLPEGGSSSVPNYGTPPPQQGAQPWQSPQDAPAESYGSPAVPPPPPPTTPSYGSASGQTYGGPAQNYSPYSAASRYPGAPGAPGSPGYGGWIASTRDNGKGTGALVMGILSVLLCFGSLLGIGLGIGAIILGNQGRRAVQGGTASNGGVATAGLILGCVGVGLSVLSSLSYLANYT